MRTQVLVFDLDRTLVHTPGPDEEHELEAHVGTGRAFDISLGNRTKQTRLVCAPRTNMMQFFLAIRNKFHVMYCTAGELRYGHAVLAGMREHMLKTMAPGDHNRKWIDICTHSG